MVRVVTGRMQETAPLIAVAFILPAGGCFDVYDDNHFEKVIQKKIEKGLTLLMT